MAAEKTGWTDDKAQDVNWDDVSTEAPPPLEPGIYQATIVKAEARATKSKGDPAINLELRVTQRYGEAVDGLSRKLYDNVVLSAGALFRLKQLGVAAEITLPPSTRTSDIEAFCGELVGQGVWLRSKLDTYQPPAVGDAPAPAARTNAKVDRYLSAEQATEAANAAAGAEAEAPKPKRRKG